MADEVKEQYPQDIDGYEYVTNALMELVPLFPGLEDEEGFRFSSVPDGEGMSITPISGAKIYEQRENINGHVKQMCEYPFMVLYKASGLNQQNKIAVKEWLDTFADWLTKQPVTIKGTTYKLADWPELTGGREIRTVEKTTPAYLAGISDDKCENWIMNMTIRYRNEFDR